MFVRNAWYALGWSAKFGSDPVRQYLLGEPIVIVRFPDGTLSVFADRCGHRRYPLSKGRLVGDQLQCGYHGFEYDGTGRCTAVPGQARAPGRADVPSYPVREVDGWVWAWAGEPAAADAALIPDHHWTADPAWVTVGGVERIRANYRLLIDNFLDLSHETFLHPGTIGNEAVATTRLTSRRDGRKVFSSRRMEDVEIPPLYVDTCGVSRGDRWQDSEFSVPNLFLLHVRIAPAGAAGGVRYKVLYAVTPETEDTTLEVWAKARDFAQDDEGVSAALEQGVLEIIEEDRAALELQHQACLDTPDAFECSVAADSASLHARRIIREMLDHEMVDASPAG